VILDIVFFSAGLSLVVMTLLSAVRTVVIPHAGSVRLTRMVFRIARRLARWYGLIDRSQHRRHRMLQVALASGLLALPIVWLSATVVGYTLMFRALGAGTWKLAYELAGSSMFTLGTARADDLPKMTLSFTGAALAISILALLLVTYLPTIYGAYTQREARLTSFETIAGDPPNVVGMFIRGHQLNSLTRLSMVWEGWREWFAELRESHTALPAVAFLGSSRNDRNWVATVGTLLDAASVSLALLDLDNADADAHAALCVRSGSLALRDIAEYFGVEVDHDPRPDAPISVDRSTWDRAYDALQQAGVPLLEREQAWIDWAGWRVNYDAALVGLAELTESPASRLMARTALDVEDDVV
jgi:hypothetical protein